MHFHILSIYLNQIMRFKHILPRMYLVYKSHLHSSKFVISLCLYNSLHDGFHSMNPILFSFGNVLTHLIISVFYHDKCRLMHPAKWSIKNSICHHDGCRLVHPAKWDILTMPYTVMMDADWCNPPCWSFCISIQFKISRIDHFVYNLINHSHAINRQTFQILNFQIHMHF